jgi:hypothetical protein
MQVGDSSVIVFGTPGANEILSGFRTGAVFHQKTEVHQLCNEDVMRLLLENKKHASVITNALRTSIRTEVDILGNRTDPIGATEMSDYSAGQIESAESLHFQIVQ